MEIKTAIHTIHKKAFAFAKKIDNLDGVRIAPSGVNIEFIHDEIRGVTYRVPFTINGNYIEACRSDLVNGKSVFSVYHCDKTGEYVSTEADNLKGLIELVKTFG